MKPLKLYIEGLQSFIQPQKIDFELISGSGLFGVFGNTGSGKSTILDAILIALYGKGSRREDYINKTVDRAQVAFEFKMLGETYKAERAFRRKRENNIECSLARLYKRTAQGWVCLAENYRRMNEEIEKIVGLGLEDFKKCVILPQGEFASFLKAEKGKRNEIIGNLFDLEQYGETLAQKIKERKAAADGEKSSIERSIEAIGDFEYSLIEQTQREIEDGQKEAERLGEMVKSLEKAHRELEEKLKQNGQFLEAKGLLEQLFAKKGEMEGQRAQLEQYKRAEKLKLYIAEYDRLKGRIGELEKNISAAKKDSSELEEKLYRAQTEAERAKKVHEERSFAINEQIPKLKACKEIVNNIEKESEELEKKRKLFQQKREELNECKRKFDEVEGKLGELKRQKEALEERLDIVSTLKKSKAEGRLEEVKQAIEYASPRFEGMLPYLNGRKRALEEALSAYSRQASSDFLGDFGELKKIEQEISKYENQWTEARTKLDSLTSYLKEIESEGKQIKAFIELSKNRLTENGAKEGWDEELLEKKIAKLKAELKSLEEKKNSAEKTYQELNLNHENKKVELKGLLKSYSDTLSELERKEREIESLLKESNFSSSDEARRILSKNLDAEGMEKALRQFEQSLLLTEDNYDKLKVKYDASVTEQSVEESAKRLNELRKEHQDKLSDLAVKRSRRDNLNSNWEKLSMLKKELKGAEKLCGHLETLQKLVRGKSFMEFVAEEYVQDITAAASRHTSHLTGGRYRLCYQGGNFFVEDNYSGGEMRAVETLSGGETFLVSLSLALALTETIVRMSDKPIEFFFLDEGFGTLDRELCDTVMNILEKLKRTNFTIGIISHVPELMQRMGSKIIVSPPDGERGSTVRHVI